MTLNRHAPEHLSEPLRLLNMKTDEKSTSAIRAGEIPGDVEMCAEIWVNALRARDGTVDAEAMSRWVHSSLEKPIVRFAVATPPLTGFALVLADREDPGEALLLYLAVDPAAAGQGTGHTLLLDAITHTRDSGFQALVLDVRTNNERAIDLYVRAGFVPVGDPTPHPIAGYPMQTYRLAL